METKFRIAFISGKLGDVDGVSLEVDKWIEVLCKEGHEVFTIAGYYENPVQGIIPENQYRLESLRFDSTLQKHYEKMMFPYITKKPTHMTSSTRDRVLEEMMVEGEDLGEDIYHYIQDNKIDLIIAENTNAMPMTLLGGIAVYNLLSEYKVATIFHHHDFWWERSRFSQSRIESLLTNIMPPSDIGSEHVVISSYSAHILSSIKRVMPTVIPNCENFENPTVPDDYNSHFRNDLGFKKDDILFVQPTRIVSRKRIEDSVRLVGKYGRRYPEIKDRIKLIISLYQGDEMDDSYIDQIKYLADRESVDLHLISERVASIRMVNDEGQRIYTSRDVLVNADIVTYLPKWEGFGNAYLESISCRVPVVISTYLVYKTDIKGAGFDNIEIRDDYTEEGLLNIPESVLDEIHIILNNSDKKQEMVNSNFKIGREEFSFNILKLKLNELLVSYSDEIRASRRRLQKSMKNYAV
ncbi:MAG: glycosyltransferase family 4 protein [Spirochaetales bacterium]|nr:glycosyltransferase family 4 protein [Spirochaetales bacterium]